MAVKLYCVVLGGKMDKGRLGEDHEVVFVVAENLRQAKTLAKKKWKGIGASVHVDSIKAILKVDGHSIRVE